MFTIWGKRRRFCDGQTRRDFLRVGALGLGGLGFVLWRRHGARLRLA